MTRIARVVVPGLPHHIVQRGVRSLPIFPAKRDRTHFLELMAQFGEQYGTEIWAWCLMSNHVHLIAVPREVESLARTFSQVHRRYSLSINRRQGVRGHLFQERFHSFPVQTDSYLLEVIRYVENNPVRAGMVERASEYEWSSARHHVLGTDDPLVCADPLGAAAKNWGDFLADSNAEKCDMIRSCSRTGRLFGSDRWIRGLEKRLHRRLAARPVGRPPNADQ